MIFACVNTKGGVGKTTTAVHLATMLARQHRTLLIDGDPQASAASWAAWRRESDYQPSPTTTCLTGKAILVKVNPCLKALSILSRMQEAVTPLAYALLCCWRSGQLFQSVPS